MRKDFSAARSINRANLSLLWTLLRPHRGTFSLAMVFLLAASAINLLFPQLGRLIVQEQVLSWMVGHPWSVAVLVIGLFAIQGIAFHFRALLFGTIGHRVVTDLRARLFSALIDRPVEFFDQQRSADLVSRLIADCAQIQDAVSVKLSVIIRYGIQVVVGVVLMAIITPRLTVMLLFGLPLLLGVSFILGKSLKRISKDLQSALGVTSTIAEETFSGQKVVKAFGAEDYEVRRFTTSNQTVLALGIARAKVAAFFASFVNFLMNVFLVLVVLYGALLVAGHELALGDLTAFLLYAAIVGVSFAFFVGTYVEFAQALGGASRVFELLSNSSSDALSQRELVSSAKASPSHEVAATAPVGIEFRNVTFSYPSRPEAQVLNEVSFAIRPGSTTALVGPSGAGKSSVVGLLLGFYLPQAGSVIVNGLPLSESSIRDARALMSYVPQDPTLFGVSLRDNLLLGNRTASDAEMIELLKELGLGPLLSALPQGLDTLPGDRALQLSGGQRQRIALARALLRNAGLLILDEATSSVDSETEQQIQNCLARRRQGKSMLIIAHRLSTVRNADQILVLEHGKIAQVGTHAELVEQPGLYRLLVERQELG